MSASLAGKVAIITGGTKGIGAATAKKLVSLGAKVVVSYSGDAAAAEAIVKELGADNITAIKSDAGSVAGVEALVCATVEKHQKVDIAIANAGVLQMVDVEHLTEAAFEKLFNVNVKGPMFLAHHVVPHMPRGGRIIFVSTSQNYASTVTPPYMLYCSTKGAIDQMTRTMAKDLGPKGINVNCVAPGPTGTDLFVEGKSEQVIKQISGLSPFGRLGDPNEVAEVHAFLSSSSASWISGQIIRVNGGMAVM